MSYEVQQLMSFQLRILNKLRNKHKVSYIMKLLRTQKNVIFVDLYYEIIIRMLTYSN